MVIGHSALAASLCLLLTACSEKRESPEKRAEAAQALFNQATKEFHIPSATATGPERAKLQQQAAAAYQQLLKQYPEQAIWAVQALRNLANLRAAQTNVDEAVRLYASVAERFPKEDFEIVQAWKSAADLLWDAGRHPAAAKFYGQIVARFDGTNQPAIVRLVVKGSKLRLEGRNIEDK